MKVGSQEALRRTNVIIDDVVVLPWVPLMAIVSNCAVMAANIEARDTTGIPNSPARAVSGFPAPIAVDATT
jgi:hypothetical protein